VGRISDEDIERVRDATDIVALVSESVVLKQKSRLYWGNCPFHSEKTPSFKVDPASGLWHCFGCGLGGDAIGFAMRTENMEFPDAVRRLAERARIEIVDEPGGMPPGAKGRLLAASEEAAEFYHRLLTTSREKGPTAARDYLRARGIGSEVARRFRLGLAPSQGSPLTAHLTRRGFTAEELVTAGLATTDDRGGTRDRFFGRIMFPIADLSGRVIAFGGRVLGDGRPKYLNSAETPLFHKSANLYAIEKAKNEIVASGVAVVVEGYTDVIALHEAGLKYAVATLGTALTEQHVNLLLRFAKRVVYLFDGDDAGIRAARRAEEFLELQTRPESSAGKLDLAVGVIPDGKDPADFVGEYGGAALAALLKDAAPLLRFAIDSRLADADLGTPEGRSGALRVVAEVLARVRDSLLVHDYSNFVADRLRVEYSTVQSAVLASARASRTRPVSSSGTAPLPPVTGSRPVTGVQDRAEDELLRLLALAPALREQARELLGWDAVSDSRNARLLGLLTEAGESTGRALYETIVARLPEAADVASSWLVDGASPENDEAVFRELVGKLKEFSLRRQINGLQARMESLDAVKDRVESDDVFRKIAALQREVDAVRRAARAGDDPMEA
jgi:DNA primase